MLDCDCILVASDSDLVSSVKSNSTLVARLLGKRLITPFHLKREPGAMSIKFLPLGHWRKLGLHCGAALAAAHPGTMSLINERCSQAKSKLVQLLDVDLVAWKANRILKDFCLDVIGFPELHAFLEKHGKLNKSQCDVSEVC